MSIRIQSDTLLNWVVTGLMDLMRVRSVGLVMVPRRVRLRLSEHVYGITYNKLMNKGGHKARLIFSSFHMYIINMTSKSNLIL